MESLACGTPVVGFHIGGNPDLIDHKHNGYLAKPFSIHDLAKGILWCLNEDSQILSMNSRNAILEKFPYEKIAQRHKTLYESLLHSN